MRLFRHLLQVTIKRTWMMIVVFLVGMPALALAEEKLSISAQQMNGFGRIVLMFPNRLDLPEYEINSENGVLSVVFSTSLDVVLPDVSGSLPSYVSITRVDPDRRGIRLGLKGDVRINHLEAGEQLFLDFLPVDWQGLDPGLPADVVAELAKRAQGAAQIAELARRIEFAKVNNPTATLHVGRHPTFVRLVFDWSEDTEAAFTTEGEVAELEFSWPVEIDIYSLISELPAEIISAQSTRLPGSNLVKFNLAEGVVSRFFKNSDRQFIVDIDLLEPDINTLSVEELLVAAEVERAVKEQNAEENALVEEAMVNGPVLVMATDQVELTPKVSRIGSTIRIAFPFDQETSAAVFRRGDYLWLVMDTTTIINAPDDENLLDTISDDFAVISAGNTQIVRIKMNDDRLASLGSQGPAWILSLGDSLMASTEAVHLERRQDNEGRFEIVAVVDRPVRVHQVRDPEVGDVLEVVTVFPPAHGVVRRLSFVDFDALPSVHGLVIKPAYEGLDVKLGAREIVLSSNAGLIVSSVSDVRGGEGDDILIHRQGYIDLGGLVFNNPLELKDQTEVLMARAADAVGRDRENARLDLSHVLLANQLGIEAIGVLDLMIAQNEVEDLLADAIMAKAAASVVAYRPIDALNLLKYGELSEALDSVMWRSIAKVQTGDFVGARIDVLASEVVAHTYPEWVKSKFFLSGILAAVETEDEEMARRMISDVDEEALSHDQISQLNLLKARLDEMDLRYDEALDTYGLVIAADVRPTRAEAIYRTILLLEKLGHLEAQKAIITLSTESIIWRGGPIEAKMLQLLARLQFENKAYRDGFSTVLEVAETQIESDAVFELTAYAQDVFSDLFINGAADAMGDIEALTLYYDFRYLTPAGARGDEMIRNLARRLIGVDLLSQAASLLEYQVDVRLDGAAKSQIAVDLAIIYIADHKSDLALGVLNRTALANLPLSLQRQRRLLEGRALIDEGRTELALDVLGQLSGRDVELLRVDAYWRAENYVKAAEQIELVYADRNIDLPLSQPARMNIIKAAVGYVLDGDNLGLSRVRARFSERLANSPEWPMFDYVTGVAVQTSADFRSVAAQIAGIDSLSAFLNSYRLTYGADGALTPAPGTART